METPKIFESEYRFCQILWAHEPVKSRELVALCAEHLGWKPTTTYTVIKRLSERGVLKNENTVVTSLISQDEAQTAEIDELLDKRFDGSLPAFVAAFTKSSHVSDKELDEVQKMIDLYRKENHHGCKDGGFTKRREALYNGQIERGVPYPGSVSGRQDQSCIQSY